MTSSSFESGKIAILSNFQKFAVFDVLLWLIVEMNFQILIGSLSCHKQSLTTYSNSPMQCKKVYN